MSAGKNHVVGEIEMISTIIDKLTFSETFDDVGSGQNKLCLFL